MKAYFAALLSLTLCIPHAIAQNDPLTGVSCPIGGNPLVGNLIHNQRFGTGSINSSSGYIPTSPFAPVIQPSPPPIVIPTITTPIISPNAGYNNFGNNNYNSPYYGNYGYYNPAATGAGLAVVGVAGFKISKSIFHKLASSNKHSHTQKPEKITKLDDGNISVNGTEYAPITALDKSK